MKDMKDIQNVSDTPTTSKQAMAGKTSNRPRCYACNQHGHMVSSCPNEEARTAHMNKWKGKKQGDVDNTSKIKQVLENVSNNEEETVQSSQESDDDWIFGSGR